jgi:hypothetical protein
MGTCGSVCNLKFMFGAYIRNETFQVKFLSLFLQ